MNDQPEKTELIESRAQRPETPSKRTWLDRFLFVQVCFFTFFSLLCLFAGWHWFADIVNSFRVQFVCVLIGIVGLYVACHQWFGVIVNTSLFAFHLVPLVPYLFFEQLSSFEPSGATVQATTFKVMSANINGENTDYEGLVNEIRRQNPDFITLIEIRKNWEPTLLKLKNEYPYQKHFFRRKNDNYGLAVLSRIKPESMMFAEYDDSSLPSVESRLKIGSKEITILSMHPPAPFGPSRSRIRDENLLYAAHDLAQFESRIMVGDFNMTPWSPTFRKVLQVGKLKDSSIGFGVSPTWFKVDFFMCGLKIDHILCSPDLVPIDYQVSPDFGSDHRAVTTVFHMQAPKWKNPQLQSTPDRIARKLER